jgi:hypothetical protein
VARGDVAISAQNLPRHKNVLKVIFFFFLFPLSILNFPNNSSRYLEVAAHDIIKILSINYQYHLLTTLTHQSHIPLTHQENY